MSRCMTFLLLFKKTDPHPDKYILYDCSFLHHLIDCVVLHSTSCPCACVPLWTKVSLNVLTHCEDLLRLTLKIKLFNYIRYFLFLILSPDPKFVGIHLIPESDNPEDDKIFLFFKENAMDGEHTGKATISRIAQLCKVTIYILPHFHTSNSYRYLWSMTFWFYSKMFACDWRLWLWVSISVTSQPSMAGNKEYDVTVLSECEGIFPCQSQQH